MELFPQIKPIPFDLVNQFFFDKLPLSSIDFSILTIGTIVAKPIEIEIGFDNDLKLYTMQKITYDGNLLKERQQLSCSICFGQITYIDDKFIIVEFDQDKTKMYLLDKASYELRNIYKISDDDFSKFSLI